MNKRVKKAFLTLGTVTALATFSANLGSVTFTAHADDSTTSSSSSNSTSQDSEKAKKIADLKKKIAKWTKLQKKAQSASKNNKKYKGPGMYTIQKNIINYTQELKLVDGTLIAGA